MGKSEIKNIGILGGMFDPVHFGHLRAALSVQQDFELDEVRLIPCHHPAHREEAQVSAQHRINMLHKACKAEKRLVVDVRECMRPGPSYMIDTIQSLRTEYPDDRLFLILGADAFNKLDTWKRWDELLDLAHIIVITRPGWDINPNPAVKEKCAGKMAKHFPDMCKSRQGLVLTHNLNPLMIASSEIRHLLKAKQSVRYLIPNNVLKYIEKHKLYR